MSHQPKRVNLSEETPSIKVKVHAREVDYFLVSENDLEALNKVESYKDIFLSLGSLCAGGCIGGTLQTLGMPPSVYSEKTIVANWALGIATCIFLAFGIAQYGDARTKRKRMFSKLEGQEETTLS